MKYKIVENKNIDGYNLVVSFPAEDVDYKALRTIQNDRPDFLLPFNSRTVDGFLECTYRVENMVRVDFFLGTKSTADYVKYWNLVLQPLIDCRDWFLNPFSFCLDLSWMFIDKDERGIRYVYVPARTDASDRDDFQRLVKDVSRRNRVDDLNLENFALRSLDDGFTPRQFLRSLDEFKRKEERIATGSSSDVSAKAVRAQPPAKPVQEPVKKQSAPPPVIPEVKQPVNTGAVSAAPSSPSSSGMGLNPSLGDLWSDSGSGHSSGDQKHTREKPAKKQKPAKPEKPPKPQKPARKLFGKKEPASVPAQPVQRPAEVVQKSNISTETVIQPFEDDGSVTVIKRSASDAPYLLYLGNVSGLPQRIEVFVPEGGRFSIGRYDVNLGRKQSDFEFSQGVSGVSRKHAVIEHRSDGYYIIDLLSKAGTYVNGMRLEPNEYVKLTPNSRISFGYDGVEYAWTV